MSPFKTFKESSIISKIQLGIFGELTVSVFILYDSAFLAIGTSKCSFFLSKSFTDIFIDNLKTTLKGALAISKILSDSKKAITFDDLFLLINFKTFKSNIFFEEYKRCHSLIIGCASIFNGTFEDGVPKKIEKYFDLTLRFLDKHETELDYETICITNSEKLIYLLELDPFKHLNT